MPARPGQPEPFLRGCAFEGAPGVPYPRADPGDSERLPGDTWRTACLPVSVRLEMTGDANGVEVAYGTATDDLGYRGDGAGRFFSLWRGGAEVDRAEACLGEGMARLEMGGGPPEAPAVVYMPEGMRPEVRRVTGVGGRISPAPPQPRWLAYGDSIAEGWVASSPAMSWPAVVGREHAIDLVNLGYAGAARGEIVSAEQMAALTADVITVSHGTNCWTRVPFSRPMMKEATAAFLEVLRQGHPLTPIVVASPVLRPDAESAPNRLGATLADLRSAMEEATEERAASGDSSMALVKGRDLLVAGDLPDGIHPGDRGHRAIARAMGAAIAAALAP